MKKQQAITQVGAMMVVGRAVRGNSRRLILVGGGLIRNRPDVRYRFIHPVSAAIQCETPSSVRAASSMEDRRRCYSTSTTLQHPENSLDNDSSVPGSPSDLSQEVLPVKNDDDTTEHPPDNDGHPQQQQEPMRPLERTILNKTYSSDTPGPDPKQSWAITSTLSHHIRAALKGIEFETDELRERDTNLAVCTLGTGSGAGSLLRSNSATMVRQGGYLFLVDAGEGLNRQFLLSRLNLRDVTHIFITHMHGDHIFGLPSLLLSLQVANLHAKEKRTLEIFGPVGLYNYVTTALALSSTEMRKMHITVYELRGGTQRSARHLSNSKQFREFSYFGVSRKTIPQNKDGTWTLVEPIEITTRELAIKHRSDPKGLYVKAAEIHHVPSIQCFGYTFVEPLTQTRPIDAEKAQGFGVTDQDCFAMLKSNFSVFTPDGNEVLPDQVCGDAPKPRKVTILGDCCVVPPAMERLAMDSEVVVHEATLSDVDKGRKAIAGGHSTAAEAAAFANKVRANVLLLNHLPRRADSYKGINQTYNEAKRHIAGRTQIQVAFDHLELLVPRGGFGFRESDAFDKASKSEDLTGKREDSEPPDVEEELPG